MLQDRGIVELIVLHLVDTNFRQGLNSRNLKLNEELNVKTGQWFQVNLLSSAMNISSVLVAQLVERPPGYTYVFAKGVSDQVRDPLTPRNSLQ